MNQNPIYRQSTQLDGKICTLYTMSSKSVPLVVEFAYLPNAETLLQDCKKKGCKDFSLLCISGFNWDQDLSPWPHAPCIMEDDDFTGNAPQFLAWIEQKVIPWALSQLTADPSYLAAAGYSMGGLFAVYAALKSSLFSRIACVSGSVWYPDFETWALKTPFLRKPEAIYFSLGNTEERTGNPWLQHTGTIMQTLAAAWRKEGIDTFFEWTSGNHFVNPIGRLAAGIRWIIAADPETQQKPD